jgi:hypothetical protein
METFGASEVQPIIEKLVNKKAETAEGEEPEDAGYIFEVDLTQGKKVGRILNELLIRHI